jgi:hypothetical protein
MSALRPEVRGLTLEVRTIAELHVLIEALDDFERKQSALGGEHHGLVARHLLNRVRLDIGREREHFCDGT